MLSQSDYQSLIEAEISHLAPKKHPDSLYEPIRYTLSGGGKRLRPVLVLSVCEALGGVAANAMNQALALEMFHNFTLLHDDVMDKADMRRGRVTVHRRWDDRTAILSGDAMLTLASQQMMEQCDEDLLGPVLRLFNDTAMKIYEGQQLDLDFENRMDVTVEEYLDMIRLKTSVLLGCACALGAIMARADRQDVEAFYRYGEALGLAFQLQDDLLDTFGDPIVFGKEIGGDIANDKKTWLLIKSLSDDTTGVVRQEILHPSETAEKIDRVKQVYLSLGLPEKCRSLIDLYVEKAITELNSVKLSHPARDFFVQLADRTRTRTH